MKMRSPAPLRSVSWTSCTGCVVSAGSNISETEGKKPKKQTLKPELKISQNSGNISTVPFSLFYILIWIDTTG